MPDQRKAARADAGKHPDGRNAIEWDKAAQLWFARPGADLERLEKWLPDRNIRSSGGGDPQSEFLDELTSAGLVLDGLPVMDGRRHRVPVVDGKKGNRDGVYRGFLEGVKPGGWYINYHRADNDKDITRWKASGSTGEADPVARVHIRAVMRQSQDDFAREQAAIYAQQTAKAKALYERLPAADPAHGYLKRKGITVADDIRQTRNGALVVPFHDADGTFRTLQYIPPDGEKYLFKDAPKSGHFRVEGGELRNGEPILYAEGYATARSLHMVTGRPVVMTIDAGNMETVASVLKVRYPDSPHLFMADVDHAKEKNKGVLSAERAATATGGVVLLPDLTAAEMENGFTDFNDLHQFRGAERLRETLLPAISQALEQLNFKETSMATSDDVQPSSDAAPLAPVSENAVVLPTSAPVVSAPSSADAAPSTSEVSHRRPGAAKEKSAEILALREQGMKPAQIAEQLGIGQTSVYRILRDSQPKVQNQEKTETTESVNEPTQSDLLQHSVAGSVASSDKEDQMSGRYADLTARLTALENDANSLAMDELTRRYYDLWEERQEILDTLNPSGDGDLTDSIKGNVATREIESRILDIISQRQDDAHEKRIHDARALIAQGQSIASVAATMNVGVSELYRLIQQDKDDSASTVTAASSDKVAGSPEQASDEDLSGELADTNYRRRGLKDETPHLNTAALGEENAILVGAPRVAPSDDDMPEGQKKARIDADKLLSRVTHEKQPDGKSVLYRLDGEPAFIDRGNRLVMADGASSHEEKVLAALLTAANHYHGRIELTGSDEFKAFAIGVIVANKLDVSMKNASQQADLDAARRAAGQPVSPAVQADAVRGDPQAPRSSETPTAAPPSQPAQKESPLQPVAPVTSSPQQSSPPTHAPEAPKISPSVHTPAEKAREPITGKVTACGQAPFRFETGQSESTFITLRNKEGALTFWGKELAGLLRETNLKPGRMVTLQWQGEQQVTVKVPQKNSDGVVTHYKSVDTHRNRWSLTPVGGARVQTGADDMVSLAAVDVNRYTQIQHALVSRLGLDIDAPPKPADGLYWLKPDGQGSSQPGDPLSAPRPALNEHAGTPVMSAWGADGRPDLLLVQGDGDYLQGVVRQNGTWQHVLVSLPGSAEAPPMVVNLLTPEGAKPIGSGNGINRSSGQPVPREHVVVRLTGDAQPRIAKLDAPSEVPAALHARLGYDERYKAESGWVKEQPAAAPQAVPATPPRPAQ
ncbi:helix-turn-helix domain-containing protein [Kosakonia radicincitans]